LVDREIEGRVVHKDGRVFTRRGRESGYWSQHHRLVVSGLPSCHTSDDVSVAAFFEIAKKGEGEQDLSFLSLKRGMPRDVLPPEPRRPWVAIVFFFLLW
jgi:hypothetical protein